MGHPGTPSQALSLLTPFSYSSLLFRLRIYLEQIERTLGTIMILRFAMLSCWDRRDLGLRLPLLKAA